MRFNWHRAGIKEATYEQGSQISQVPANPFPNSSGQLGRCGTKSRSSKQAADFFLKPARGREHQIIQGNSSAGWCQGSDHPSRKHNTRCYLMQLKSLWTVWARNNRTDPAFNSSLKTSLHKKCRSRTGFHCICITEEELQKFSWETSTAPSSNPPSHNKSPQLNRETLLELPQYYILPPSPPRKFQIKCLVYHTGKSSSFPGQPVWEHLFPSCFRTQDINEFFIH